MKVSICLATYNKPKYLQKVLPAVLKSSHGLDREVIVVDDGSHTSESYDVCQALPVKYIRIDRQPNDYRNPSVARNVAYRAARGEIIIAISDDVVPQGGAIRNLVESLRPGEFLIASVFNRNWQGRPQLLYNRYHELTGPGWKRPLFFLGALWRKDLYTVGGNDERFTAPGREDIWFADCLMHHLGLIPRWTAEAIGWHLHHPRPPDLARITAPSNALYRRLVAGASSGRIPWTSEEAPWKYSPRPTVPLLAVGVSKDGLPC